MFADGFIVSLSYPRPPPPAKVLFLTFPASEDFLLEVSRTAIDTQHRHCTHPSSEFLCRLSSKNRAKSIENELQKIRKSVIIKLCD
jgi:hypothetical protein